MAMGRPRKDESDKRSYTLNVRFNREEQQKLNECVEFYAIKKTEVLMAGLNIMYDDMQTKKKSNG